MANFWTERGIEILGKVVKRARESCGLTLRDVEKLTEEIGEGDHKVSRVTMNNLEHGQRIPAYNTVVAIAALKFVRHPFTGEPFTEQELSDIAAELLDPETGRYTLGNQEPTIANLIKLELKNRSKEVERLAMEKLTEVTELNSERMKALIEGERPTDEELAALAQVLTKDDGSHWTEVELRELRASVFPSELEEGMSANSDNQLHLTEDSKDSDV